MTVFLALYICAYMHLQVCTHTSTCIHIIYCIHTHTQTHTDTYTYTQVFGQIHSNFKDGWNDGITPRSQKPRKKHRPPTRRNCVCD
jgi:hypothetical protein